MRRITGFFLALAIVLPGAALAQRAQLNQGQNERSLYDAQKSVDVKNVPGEKVLFDSTTPMMLPELLHGSGPPAKVEGHLQMPDKPKGPVPAVIIFNCGDTIKSFKELAYADELKAQGYAVFIVNSFATRGASGDQGNFSACAMPRRPTRWPL